MSAVKHCVIVIAYGVFAAVAGLLLPVRLPELGNEFGATFGVALFMVAALLHQYLARGERDAAVHDQIHSLNADNERMREEIDLLREEGRTIRAGLTDITDGLEQRAEQQVQKVAAEVRVLRNLIQQLSAGQSIDADYQAVPSLRIVDADFKKPLAAPPARLTRRTLGQAEILDIVREGLKRDRVDLYLQPVVSLPQRKPRFYECFSRIRAEDGTMIVPEQYIELAKQDGLLRTIDNMLLFRCMQLVRKAQRHRHNLRFFCNISVHTLKDRAFFREFIDYMTRNQDLASQLLFEFAEDDVNEHWDDVAQDLHTLARLGFYFSLDRVRGFDLDPQLLARRHFKFVKLEAGALLASGAKEGLNIRAFKRELDRHGLDLVVEKIETEQQLVELLDHNIDFGQGFLFGEPRLSRGGQ